MKIKRFFSLILGIMWCCNTSMIFSMEQGNASSQSRALTRVNHLPLELQAHIGAFCATKSSEKEILPQTLQDIKNFTLVCRTTRDSLQTPLATKNVIKNIHKNYGLCKTFVAYQLKTSAANEWLNEWVKKNQARMQFALENLQHICEEWSTLPQYATLCLGKENEKIRQKVFCLLSLKDIWKISGRQQKDEGYVSSSSASMITMYVTPALLTALCYFTQQPRSLVKETLRLVSPYCQYVEGEPFLECVENICISQYAAELDDSLQGVRINLWAGYEKALRAPRVMKYDHVLQARKEAYRIAQVQGKSATCFDERHGNSIPGFMQEVMDQIKHALDFSSQFSTKNVSSSDEDTAGTDPFAEPAEEFAQEYSDDEQENSDDDMYA